MASGWETSLALEVRCSFGDGLDGVSLAVPVSRCLQLRAEIEAELSDGLPMPMVLVGVDELEARLAEARGRRDSALVARACESWLAKLVCDPRAKRAAALARFLGAGGVGAPRSEASARAIADFILLGANEHHVKVGRRDRQTFSQPVAAGETVFWQCLVAPRAMSLDTADLEFTVGFVASDDAKARPAGLIASSLEPLEPLAGFDRRAAPDESAVSGDFSTLDAGRLLFVWHNESRLAEKRLTFKVVHCSAAAYAAATVAAAEEAQRRECAASQGDLERRLRESSPANMVVRCTAADDDSPKAAEAKTPPAPQRTGSVTGLHIRDRIRASIAAQGAASADRVSVDREEQLERLRRAYELTEAAAAQMSQLEDEAAAAEARARSAAGAADLQRAQRDAEQKDFKRQRDVLHAEKRMAEDRCARADARAAVAEGALRALVDFELSRFAPGQTNPFVQRIAAGDAEATWARLGAGDGAAAAAIADARSAAAAAAAAVERLDVDVAVSQATVARLSDEKRLLVGEFKRLRKAADDRVAAAKADADEARMVQRQLAAHAKRLKEERLMLARQLSTLHVSPDGKLPGSARSAALLDEGLVSDYIPRSSRDGAAPRSGSNEPPRRSDTPPRRAGTPPLLPPSPTRKSADDAPRAAAAVAEPRATVEGDEALSPAGAAPHPPPSTATAVVVATPSAGVCAERSAARRSALAAKLEGCRERQRQLATVLEQQPDSETMKGLKVKLDEATRKLELQLRQLDAA